MVLYSKPLPPIVEPHLSRFHERFDKTAKNDCWKWTSSIDPYGYGYLSIHQKKIRVHRIAYLLQFNLDPVGYLVCHTCDIRSCINPKHLFLGTNVENSNDRDSKGRTAKGNQHASRIYVGAPYLPRGEQHPNHKLNVQAILAIRRMHSNGLTQRAIAYAIGVKEITVWKVIHRKTWAHVK